MMRKFTTLTTFVMAVPSLGAQTAIHTFANESPGSWSRVEHAGDVDMDGRPDVVVSGTAGVRVFSGLNGLTIFSYQGQSGDGVGDMNLDGYDDLVVGDLSHQVNGESVGAASIYSGQDGSLLFSAFGEALPTSPYPTILRVGGFVAGPGDTDGDGHPDWMTSRSGTTVFGDAALLYSGQDGSLRFLFPDTFGEPTWDQHIEMAGAGDPNQDGYVDLLISFVPSPFFVNCSASVELRSGIDGALIRKLTEPTICAFGLGLAGGGDLDGDGVDDQIIGSPFAYWDDGATFNGGATIAVSGATGERLFIREAANSLGSYGAGNDVAGDVNMDGEIDVITGDSFASSSAFGAGAAEVLLGGAGPRLDCTIDGGVRLASQGAAVAGLGDVDLDGRDDVVTLEADFLHVPGSTSGQATIWSFEGCTAAPPWFRPGSTLRGEITASDDIDMAEFDAIAGTKIKVKLISVSGDLAPLIELRRSGGKLVKSWTPKPGDKAKKVVLKKTDRYTLSVTGIAGSSGSWQVTTKAKIKGGTWAEKLVTKKAKSASKPPRVTVPAVAGAHMWITVVPKKPLGVPLNIRLIGPLGKIDVEPFEGLNSEETDHAHVVLNVPVTGDYTVEVVDAVPDAKYELYVAAHQPRGAELIDVD